MRPDERFSRQDKDFWAYVRSISETIGYTQRRTQQVRVPTPSEIVTCLNKRALNPTYLVDVTTNAPTQLGTHVIAYFQHRADSLNNQVYPNLMDATEAEALFSELYQKLNPTCPIPMNKQKGEKRVPSYLTGIVNMVFDANASGAPCNYNPGALTTITRDGRAIRTLARRVDGAFPDTVNPLAIWEIKEHYFTTTFGSRVADGVYETLLDGMELEELHEHECIDVKHYLIVDARYTWWGLGRSYLCRIIDMLHMGYVDEVLFGREVVVELPRIASELAAEHKFRFEHPDGARNIGIPEL